MWTSTYRLAGVLALVAASLHAQSITISSVQSSLPNASIPVNLQAVTTGSSSLPGNFWIWLNGGFFAGVPATVTWNDSGTVTPLTIAQRVSGNTIIVDVPLSLVSTPVAAPRNVTITVSQQITTVVTATTQFTLNPPFTTAPTTLPIASVGVPYSAALASGGTPAFALLSGHNVIGLILDSKNPDIAGTPTSAGVFSFDATYSDAWGNTAGNSTFIVQSVAAATLGSLSQPSVAAGSDFVTLTLNGTNFVGPTTPYGQSLVLWTFGGVTTSLNTAYLSATQLQVTVPTALLATAGTATLSVLQPDSTTSNGLPFAVLAPTLASITPSRGVSGGAAFQMTLTGANFAFRLGAGSVVIAPTVQVGTTTLPSTFVNAGTLTVTIPANLAANTYPVSVINPGGSTSNSVNLVVNPPPSITTTTLPTGTATVTYSTLLAATNGFPPYTWLITGLPSNLVYDPSTGLISGTPAAPGSFSLRVSITDSANFTASASLTLTIVGLPSITTASLPVGTAGKAYSAQLAAIGGLAPYTWTILGLPAGLTPSATGAITGTTSVSGTFPISISLADSASGTASTTLNLTIVPPLSITTTSLPSVLINTAYNTTLNATGGSSPYTWTITGLPAGLTPNAQTGAITGTPTASGTFPVAITVTDSIANTANVTLSLVVNSLPTITTTSLLSGTAGQAYSAQVNASGGVTPYTWTITGLPAGLTPNAQTGAIAGTPTASGTFQVLIVVHDSINSTAQVTLPLVINSLPTVSTASLPPATIGSAYSTQASAVGGVPPYTWAITGLPAGLTPNAQTGAITGTPTVSGTFPVVLRVTDSTSNSTQVTLSLVVNSLPSITTTTLPGGTAGSAYSAQVAAANGVPPYTWNITGLPAGLAPNAQTGAITGTPTAPGTSQVVARVTDSNNSTAQATLSLTINTPPTITTTSLPVGNIGIAYATVAAVSGGAPPYTWNITGLPSGFIFNAQTGAIAGVPAASGTSQVLLRVTDSVNGAAQVTLPLVVNPLPTITTTALPSGTVGIAYSTQVAATGGAPPYTWSIIGLHPGLTANSQTGAITGTPTTAGTSQVSIVATDSVGNNAQATLPLLINASLSITTTALPSGMVAVAYSAHATATGGTPPYTWNISGLPAGLTGNAQTGDITGTPTTAGTYQVTLAATDAVGTMAQAILALTINAPPSITTTSIPSGTVGVAYSTQIAVSNGFPPFSWSSNGLPAGLTLNAQTGAITGTPTTAGTSQVSVQLVDQQDFTAQATFTLVINSTLTITTSFLPSGSVGVAYSAQVAATGGVAPLIWTITGLPAGLNASTQTGAISGTPTASGTFQVALKVTDTANGAAQVTLPLVITSLPVITTSALPPGTPGTPYSTRLTATSGVPPYTWTVTGLPNGLAANPQTGDISGIPTTAATSQVAVKVTDSRAASASATFALVISNPPPIITTQSPLPAGTVGSYYFAAFTTSGGASVTYTLVSGALPDGTILDRQGAVLGTPTKAGTFTFTILSEDQQGNAPTKTFTITIAPPPLTIPGTPPSSLPVGTPVNISLVATGGVPPYKYSINCTLPAGLSFANGIITGTPTTTGTTNCTETATDSANVTAAKDITLNITPPGLGLSGGPLTAGKVGVPYSMQVPATGGVPPYTFTASGLPPGLTLATDGTITGTPSKEGQFTFTVTVSDSASPRAAAAGVTVTATYTLTIAPATVTVTTQSLPNATAGGAYTMTLAATGGIPPHTWTVTGLPAGLTATPEGVISGTPTVFGAFTIDVVAKDVSGATATASFTLTVAPPQLTITTTSLAGGTVGTDYNASVAATGGAPPLTFSATGLPAGLSISNAGAITGKPTAPGNFNVTVTVRDSAGTTATKSLAIAVALPPTPAFSFGGVGATASPLQQLRLTVSLATPFPLDVVTNLTLAFTPDAGADDPAIQFSSGGRTASITIPAGSTNGANDVGIQTGSVAGQIVITARLQSGGIDITPSPAPQQVIRINAASPSITGATATRTSTGFTVTVTGFVTNREVTQAVFQLNAASGANLQTTSITVPVEALFTAYFASAASAPFGGQFLFTQSFVVTGNLQAVTSVSVTLVNRLGSSPPFSATF